MSSPKIILVLGMHRSGTSLVTQLVAHAGAYAGQDLLPANSANETGYWEHRPLVDFHDDLLVAVSGHWLYPPADRLDFSTVSQDFRERGRALIADMDRDGRPWVWKDPRMCVLLPFWEPLLAERDVSVVFVHRHPAEVARSLERRESIPVNASYHLWLTSIRGIVRFLNVSDTPCLFLAYPDLMRSPVPVIECLCEFLARRGVHASASTLAGLVRADLRNNVLPQVVPQELVKFSRTLDYLSSLESPAAMAGSSFSLERLDAVPWLAELELLRLRKVHVEEPLWRLRQRAKRLLGLAPRGIDT